jgi:hypothetical protein
VCQMGAISIMDIGMSNFCWVHANSSLPNGVTKPQKPEQSNLSIVSQTLKKRNRLGIFGIKVYEISVVLVSISSRRYICNPGKNST